MEAHLNRRHLYFIRVCFLMKFPLYFLHYWLPKLHVEANTLARIVLAGLLLKIGVIGFLRLAPVLKREANPVFFVGFMGVLRGSLISLAQRDIKAQAAFISICHISRVFICFLFIRTITLRRVLILALNHGFLRTLVF